MVALPSLDVCVDAVFDASCVMNPTASWPCVISWRQEHRLREMTRTSTCLQAYWQAFRHCGRAEALRQNGPPRGKERSGILERAQLTCRTCQSFAGVSSWTSLWWDWPYGSARKCERACTFGVPRRPAMCDFTACVCVRSRREGGCWLVSTVGGGKMYFFVE